MCIDIVPRSLRSTPYRAAALCLALAIATTQAAELVTLTQGNYTEYAPAGKEAEAVIGDTVLRNDRIVLAVAFTEIKSLLGRSAQRWSIPAVYGCIVDLTSRDRPNDQLVALYPTHLRYQPDAPGRQDELMDTALAPSLTSRETQQGTRVTLTMPGFLLNGGRSLQSIADLPAARRPPPAPSLDLTYVLEDGWDYVLIEAVYRNPTDEPVAFDRAWTIRTDPNLQRGVSHGVSWVHDAAWKQAYALIPDGFDFVPHASGGAAYSRDGRAGMPTIAPGGERRVTMRLAVGRSLFDVLAIADRLRGREPGADAAPGVAPSGGGALQAAITDREGKGLPVTVEVSGRGDTPSPDFFNATGAELVLNRIHARDGTATQALPAGDYRATLSRGAEYEAMAFNITIRDGETTTLTHTLRRVVDTTGWIAADLHNHSTVSGESQIFYMSTKPAYTRDASVDGDSFASPAGRVLSLACSGIDFGPATEHNFIYTYEPMVTQLGLGKWLATCPGVGMTAGRRHARLHVNGFPVPLRPGLMDGGVLQRPEHTLMQPWMAEKWAGGDKLMVICKPRQERLTVRRNMDALDLYDLRPLVDGQPIDGTDNIALEWLDILRQGYRLPGVVGSGGFDNAQASGRQFVYVRSKTDDPSAIDPMNVVRAVRAGQAVMTTGPFMTVEIETTFRGAQIIAGPGAEAVSDDGVCTLRVRLQCPDRIELERLQVLVNGNHDPALDFTDHGNADREAGLITLERVLPVTFDEDSFVIVVASGRDHADATLLPGGPRVHVTVANPIHVDVGGDGYAPHSPLDDAVTPSIQWLRPPLARHGAEPGILRVRLRNTGRSTARDVIAPEFDPPDRFELVGEKRQSYELDPGGEMDLEFQCRVSETHLARGLPADTISYVETGPRVHVPRSALAPGRRAVSTRVVIHHSLSQFDPVTSAEGIADILAGEPPHPIERGRQLAIVRWGLIGPDVAIHASVSDQAMKREKVIWQGSCVELFAANDRKDEGKRIAQVYLLPTVGTQGAVAFQEQQGSIVPAPTVQVVSRPSADGYELQALVPLGLLPIDITTGLARMDIRVNAGDRNGRMLRATIFKSGAPHIDHLQYGRMRIRGKVAPHVELVRPIDGNPGGDPGKVRVTLTNRSERPASDIAQLQLTPDGVLHVLGKAEMAFTLDPGQTASRVFELALQEGANAGLAEVWVGTSPQRQVYPSTRVEIPITPRNIVRRPPVLSLDELTAALHGAQPYALKSQGEQVAALRFAVVGRSVAVEADVVDAHPIQHADPWRASCLELFGAMPASETPKIGQVFLVPAVGDAPAKALIKRGQEYTEAPGAQVNSESTGTGYRLHALIPFALLELDPFASVIAMEIQLTAVLEPAAKPKVRRGSLFGSKLAYMDASGYGRFRIVDVDADAEHGGEE